MATKTAVIQPGQKKKKEVYERHKKTKALKEVTIHILTGDGKLKVLDTFKATNTIEDVKKRYREKENNGLPLEKIVFTSTTARSSGSVVLDNNKTLSCPEYKFHKKRHLVAFTLIIKVTGGSKTTEYKSVETKSKEPKKKKRFLDDEDSDIEISKKEDCLFGYTDKDGIRRAEMDCGHAMASQTMFDWINNLLTESGDNSKIYCPICKKSWSFELCAKIADMNTTEYMKYYGIVSKRNSKEVKQCPNKKCGGYCERPKNLTMFRVNCPACSGSDFCFLCGNKWNATGFQCCGNEKCASFLINKQLKESYENPVKATNGVLVPRFRACPKCFRFIKYTDKCKHMTCFMCKHEFCFSCLSPGPDYKCGSYGDKCKLAPAQQLK